MRHLWNVLLKGLAVVLPIALTLYLVYWVCLSIEQLVKPVILLVLPRAWYLPGMGLIAGLALLSIIGLAVNAWIVQRAIGAGERFVERIPLIKSVYGALRDFMDYFAATRERGQLRQVVMVQIADTRLLGLLTQERITELPAEGLPGDLVGVYLPMSYQIGGYTVYVSRASVTPVNLSIEEAMRWALTAGLSRAAGPAASSVAGP